MKNTTSTEELRKWHQQEVQCVLALYCCGKLIKTNDHPKYNDMVWKTFGTKPGDANHSYFSSNLVDGLVYKGIIGKLGNEKVIYAYLRHEQRPDLPGVNIPPEAPF